MDNRSNDQRNQAALEHPLPGQFWHEMLVPILMVMKVFDNGDVAIAKYVRDEEDFELDKVERITIEELRTRLSYQSNPSRLYADVASTVQTWVYGYLDKIN
jgi:hypothetical protein